LTSSSADSCLLLPPASSRAHAGGAFPSNPIVRRMNHEFVLLLLCFLPASPHGDDGPLTLRFFFPFSLTNDLRAFPGDFPFQSPSTSLRNFVIRPPFRFLGRLFQLGRCCSLLSVAVVPWNTIFFFFLPRALVFLPSLSDSISLTASDLRSKFSLFSIVFFSSPSVHRLY